MPPSSISLLHLASPGLGETAPAHDTSDLIVVSGNLSRCALPAAYRRTRESLTTLCRRFMIGHDRVAMVPGDHDVNHKKCHAYFLQCEDEESGPESPYWPKWDPYERFFNDFYSDVKSAEFLPGRWWSLFPYDDRKVVFAGFNSTTGHSHLRQVAACGDEQLTWFADRLEAYRREQWLCVGLIHHNPALKDGAGALHDRELFRSLIAGKLDLLVHGQPGRELMWLNRLPAHDPGAHLNRLPVLGPGAALIRLHPDRIEMTGETAETWEVPHRFAARAVFPAGAAGTRAVAVGGDNRGVIITGDGHAGAPLAEHQADDLLARVQRIAEAKMPDAVVEPQRPPHEHIGFLRVTRRDGGVVSCYPIGVGEGRITPEAVDAFIATVDDRYRTADPQLTSYYVYEGDPAPGELKERAQARGVLLRSLPEFQGLYDLRPYAERQAQRLARDPVYPSELYVGQRFTVAGTRQTSASKENLLEQIRQWASDHDSRFVVVLGDSGQGKTFLLREVVRSISHRHEPPIIPVLVELGRLDQAQGLLETLISHLTREGEERVDRMVLQALIQDGRVLLLFDGFDELAARMTYEDAATYLESLIGAAGGRAKVVLTSRTRHFLSDQEVETPLAARLGALPGRRLVRLSGFDTDQMLRFLTNRLGDPAIAGERLEWLHAVGGLPDLARNPRMLDLVARLGQDTLLEIRSRHGTVTAALLYRHLLEHWLEQEDERPGAALTAEGRRAIATRTALRMWERGEPTLDLAELAAICAALPEPAGRRITTDEAADMVRTGTLLVPTGEARFAFAHPSVMEWLVAGHLAGQLHHLDRYPAGLAGKPASEPLVEFLIEQAGEDVAGRWADAMMRIAEPDQLLLALEVRNRLAARRHRAGQERAGLTGPEMKGADLRGLHGYAGADLAGADLEKADLREATLSGANLSAARLRAADLREAVLSSAPGQARTTLAGADLRDVDLSGARLIGVDLRGAKTHGARWRRAALTGADLPGDFDPGDDAFFGAAPPRETRPRLELPPPGRRVTSMAWHPEGGLLATAENGAACLWDPAQTSPIATLAEDSAHIVAVTWHPDGRRLTTAARDGTIWDWDVMARRPTLPARGSHGRVRDLAWHPDGRTLAVLSAHGTLSFPGSGLAPFDPGVRVRAFAWHPDGRGIALVSEEGRIELWHVPTWQHRRTISKGTGRARDICWSPDGGYLMVVLETGRVHLWEDLDREHPIRTPVHPRGPGLCAAWDPRGTRFIVATDGGLETWDAGTLDRSLPQPARPAVRAVAWHPSGESLASGGDEGLLVWDARTGHPVSRYSRHFRTVRSVAWRSDGDRLATTCGDGSVFVFSSDGELRHHIARENVPFSGVCFKPDDDDLLLAGPAGLQVSDLSTGRISRRFRAEPRSVPCVAWRPGGDLIAAAGRGSVCFWDPDVGAIIGVLTDEAGEIDALAWHPEGHSLISLGTRGLIEWNISTGRRSRPVPEPLAAHALSVSWHPDGRRLAIGGSDGAIRIWDTGRRALTATLVPLPGGSAAFSGDGLAYRYSGDPDGRFWWSSGLCTFAPGELDPYVAALRRVPDDTPLADLGRR